jgi:hypothetical protein
VWKTARSRGRVAAVITGPVLALTLLTGGAAPASATHPKVVQGTLTDEGFQCPALRGDDGHLYTLAGSLRGHEVGDHVLVVGTVAHANFCSQGTTISVLAIEDSP